MTDEPTRIDKAHTALEHALEDWDGVKVTDRQLLLLRVAEVQAHLAQAEALQTIAAEIDRRQQMKVFAPVLPG